MKLDATFYCIAMSTGHRRTWRMYIDNVGKRLYRERIHVVEFLLHLENKQHDKLCRDSTLPRHVCVIY